MPTRKYTSLPYTELETATGNFDSNRTTIDRIVIHTMAGTWEGAAARFDNPASVVSAHYGVKYDGGLIAWLEEYNVAYANGNYAMNQRAISIEHEDMGNYNDPRPDVLYEASAKLVADICHYYNIPIDRTHILKHSEVIATGCPDALDIDRIVRLAGGNSVGTTGTVVDSATFSKLVHNSTLYDAFNKAGYTTVDDVTKVVGDLLKKNTDLQAKVDSLSTSSQTPSTGDSDALQKVSAKLVAIHSAVYDKWTFYPGKYYWVSQLHRVKAIFETT